MIVCYEHHFRIYEKFVERIKNNMVLNGCVVNDSNKHTVRHNIIVHSIIW